MTAVHHLSGRDAPLLEDVDVRCAVPAGVGAAVYARRTGQRVLLGRHHNFLGGAHAYSEIGTSRAVDAESVGRPGVARRPAAMPFITERAIPNDCAWTAR